MRSYLELKEKGTSRQGSGTSAISKSKKGSGKTEFILHTEDASGKFPNQNSNYNNVK